MEVQVRSVTAVLRGWMKVSVEIRDDFGSCDLVNLPGNMVVLCCSCYSWVWHLLYSTWYTLDKDATGFCLSISEWPCAISTLRNTGVQMPESSSFIQLPGWGGSQTTSIRIPYSVLEDLEAYGTGGAQGVPDRTYPTIDAIASAGRAGTSTSPRHIESQLERVKHERELWLGASRVSGIKQ